ncbi:MAG TPA: glycosyltransferase family 1 protein [Burkholderiaceae bacterium]|nr:glycosyltransferase family 1 protein [Burkholderiaceae bacterium]
MATPEPEVLINGRFLGQRVTGVQRYARETLFALDDLLGDGAGAGLRWTVLVPRGTPVPSLQHVLVETLGRLQGHWWEQIELAWRARAGLLVSFGFTGPWLIRQQIVTVHDAAVVRWPQGFSAAFVQAYQHLVRRITAHAPRTMTVSQFSAAEAVECFGAPRERLRVTLEGWQHLLRVTADDRILDRHGLRGQRFALAVSSPTPAKNLAVIAQALGQLGQQAPRCVVTGAADPAVFRQVDTPGDALRRLGYVTDAELKSLYGHATCFVFPSLYEGFGIPPLEAMACDCPVIASSVPALREVCGDAAMYFEATRAEELATQLRTLFSDESLRQRLREAGRRRLERFSWRASAERHMTAIREVLQP